MDSLRRNRWGALLLFFTALVLGSWLGSVMPMSPESAAQPPAAPDTRADVHKVEDQGEFYSDDSPIIRVVEKVKDAVVNVEAQSAEDRSTDQGIFPFFHPPMGREQSYGSGFFIRPDGTILTNAHVVTGAERVTVRLSDEHEYDAEILGVDPLTDLAVLRVDTKHTVPYIELGDSDHLKIGQWVVAIGNPFPSQRLDRTVTVGVVSGVGRSALYFGTETPVYQSYIQTDAAINPGNSGGPLVDLSGRAVGINAAIASPSGGNVGIGFAIPVSYVTAVLDDLMTEGKVTRGYLGVRPAELTRDMAEALELPSSRGVVVEEVVSGGPADHYGVKQGDVIVRFNGEPVTDVQQFMFLVAQVRPGTKVDLVVIRDGREQSLGVQLADRAEADAEPRPDSRRGSSEPDTWFGMQVRTATPELAERFSVAFQAGVIVVDVEPGSAADVREIARGDIITSIQREKVASVEDFRRIRARYEGLDRPVLFLLQDSSGQPHFVALKER